MKSIAYDDYSPVFDLFSDRRLYPHLWQFIETVSVYIGRDSVRLADIGGGTGLFTAYLLNHCPGLEVSFVEPTPAMLAQAKSRELPRTVFIEQGIAEALPTLEPHDWFMLQRSLYALCENHQELARLLRKLFDLTRPGGGVFVFELIDRFDIAAHREYLEGKHTLLNMPENDFNKAVEVFMSVMAQFNQDIASGIYCKLSRDEIILLFEEAGYVLDLYHRHSFVFLKADD